MTTSTEHTAPNSAKRIALALAVLAVVLVGAAVLYGLSLSEPANGRTVHIEAAQTFLKNVRTTGTVPAPTDNAAPLPHVDDPKHRKTLFIAEMLPLIVRENERILDQRARAQSVDRQSPQYTALAHAYGLDPDATRAALLRRIDIIPASLALAQGAVESGWGTSRFAQEGNAYFGERTYSEDVSGIEPGDASGFKVRSFPNPRLSVRSFMKTLNTHPAYRRLRAKRAELRAQGLRPTGLALVPFLKSYSEIGQKYIRRITVTIQANSLAKFEHLQIAGR